MERYDHKNVPLARSLRKNMTPWERHLWYDFLKGYPVRFQRQKPIGNYIVDFYCSRVRVAVELDGGQHYEKDTIQKDNERTKFLNSLGITVLRYSNLKIDKNFVGVCEDIDRNIKLELPPALRATSLTEGGFKGSSSD